MLFDDFALLAAADDLPVVALPARHEVGPVCPGAACSSKVQELHRRAVRNLGHQQIAEGQHLRTFPKRYNLNSVAVLAGVIGAVHSHKKRTVERTAANSEVVLARFAHIVDENSSGRVLACRVLEDLKVVALCWTSEARQLDGLAAVGFGEALARGKALRLASNTALPITAGLNGDIAAQDETNDQQKAEQ